MIEFIFIMVLGLICYFIGFFFGRVTKTRLEMRADECKTYKDMAMSTQSVAGRQKTTKIG